MYAIHHRRSVNSKKDYVVVATGLRALEAAKEARIVSGDLVVYEYNHEVVGSYAWLWDWERADEMCYAQRAIREANK